MRTIMFVFAGREANMRLQVPLFQRMLDDHPEMELHIWNLARTESDEEYVRTLSSIHERSVVMDLFAGDDPWKRFNDVYRYYAVPRFADCLFVKLDDDVVFIETDGLKGFLAEVQGHPRAVVSATVVNNGACTRVEPALAKIARGIPRLMLLDVHKSRRFAERSHQFFLDRWGAMLTRDPGLTNCPDWLSINFIGYDYAMGVKIADLLDAPSPRRIAGRIFGPRAKLGDEGTVNTLPRLIYSGMTVCHLYFGPQAKSMSFKQLADLRARYAEVGQNYLELT